MTYFSFILKSVAIFVVMIATVIAAHAQFSGSGSGTLGDPYLIKTAEQLDQMRNNMSAYYKLANDIDLTEYLSLGNPGYNDGAGWEPVGNYNKPFTGSLNGDGHRITGLWISRSSTEYVGLFGYIESSNIESIGVEIAEAGVNGSSFVGGLVGGVYSGSYITITNCYVIGNVSGKDYGVGGLVGTITAFNNSSINNCYASGNVSGIRVVGCLVGYTRCIINNCYASGNVSGNNYVGGLAGDNVGIIKNCVSANESITTIETGIINRVTYNIGGIIQNNYAYCDMEVKINGESISITDGLNTGSGMGKTLAVLKSELFYTTPGNWEDNTDWDFIHIWKICEGESFPLLRWQNINCADIITFPTATTVSYGSALSASTLTGGSTYRGSFEWADASIIPNVINDGYSVEFTPGDAYDYTNVEGWNGEKVVRTVRVNVIPQSITVTANSGHSVYGDSPLNPGLSATGLVNDETEHVLTGLYNSFGITSSTSSGSHILNVSGKLTNDNYTVATVNDGTWTVGKLPLAIKAVDKTIDFGQSTVLGYVFISGNLIGNDVLSGELTSDFNTVGTHPIEQGTLSAGDNYSIAFTPGTLTVRSIDYGITDIFFDGKKAERSGNNFHAVAECDVDVAEINVITSIYATVEINGTAQNPYTLKLTNYGINTVAITVTAQSGKMEYYFLTVNRPIPAGVAYYDRFDGVLTVPLYIEGIGEVNTVEWYCNDMLLDRDPSKGYIETKEAGIYYAVINGDIRTCEVIGNKSAKALNISVYPNPAVSGQHVTVSVSLSAAELEGAKLQIYSIDGRLLQTIPVTGSEMTVTTPAIKSVSIIRLISKSGSKDVKLVIE